MTNQCGSVNDSDSAAIFVRLCIVLRAPMPADHRSSPATNRRRQHYVAIPERWIEFLRTLYNFVLYLHTAMALVMSGANVYCYNIYPLPLFHALVMPSF